MTDEEYEERVANMEDAVPDLEEFKELASRSYGWTIACDGTIAGLVAGDMGYDFSTVQLGALVQHCLGEGSGHEIGDELNKKVSELIELCKEMLG